MVSVPTTSNVVLRRVAAEIAFLRHCRWTVQQGMQGDSNIGKGDEESCSGARGAPYDPRYETGDSTTWADARRTRGVRDESGRRFA